MDKFVICDICMEVYDGGLRCPRIFTCGHSFCFSCIQKLLAESSCCPTCKVPIEEGSLESISINYVLKQMAEEFLSKNASDTSDSFVSKEKECKTQPKVKTIPSKGYCKVHKVPKRFRCMTCNMWICGDCGLISHKLCKTLLDKEAIQEMKEENSIKITKHLATISESEVDFLNLLGHYKDILGVKNEELQCYQQKVIVLKEEICEANRNIEKVSYLQTVLASHKEKFEHQMKASNAASSANDLDKIEEKLTEHFSSLKELTEDLKFYKSSILENAESENKDTFDNKFDDCLKTMTGKMEWPTKIFLQFSSDGVPLGDVIIRLQESSKDATKTVLHSCLFGVGGKAVKGVGLFDGVFGEFIRLEDWLSVPSDVDGEALLKEKKTKIWNEGEMGLHVSNGNNGMLFGFSIFAERSNLELKYIPTGQVEKGIEVVKDAYERTRRGEEVKVLNCGWILN